MRSHDVVRPEDHPTVKMIGMQFPGTTGIFNLTTDEMKQNYISISPQVVAKYDLYGYGIDYERNNFSNEKPSPISHPSFCATFSPGT